MGEILVHAVGNGAVVVERSKHLADGVQNVLDAVDVEEGFLLSGERGIGQVFRRGRGAHGEAAFAGGDKRVVVRADLFFQLLRQRCFDDPVADTAPGLGQRRHILHVQRGKFFFDALVQSLVRQKIAISLRRGGEAAGDMDAG